MRPSERLKMTIGFFTLIKELNMNKKLLCAALLGGLGVAQAASAQDFDDRWYVAGSTGVNFQDTTAIPKTPSSAPSASASSSTRTGRSTPN